MSMSMVIVMDVMDMDGRTCHMVMVMDMVMVVHHHVSCHKLSVYLLCIVLLLVVVLLSMTAFEW